MFVYSAVHKLCIFINGKIFFFFLSDKKIYIIMGIISISDTRHGETNSKSAKAIKIKETCVSKKLKKMRV